jgi:hypothetical protein
MITINFYDLRGYSTRKLQEPEDCNFFAQDIWQACVECFGKMTLDCTVGVPLPHAPFTPPNFVQGRH